LLRGEVAMTETNRYWESAKKIGGAFDLVTLPFLMNPFTFATISITSFTVRCIGSFVSDVNGTKDVIPDP